jgi:hypothetical protein
VNADLVMSSDADRQLGKPVNVRTSRRDFGRHRSGRLRFFSSSIPPQRLAEARDKISPGEAETGAEP